MAVAMSADQTINLERAFSAKNYKFGESSLVVRAQELAQQLHISPESFANQYESFALIRCVRSHVLPPLAIPSLLGVECGGAAKSPFYGH